MRLSTLLAAAAVTTLGTAAAAPLAAQEADSARASWEVRAEDSLLKSDAVAVRELRAAAERGIALAQLGAEKAASENVRELAAKIEADQRATLEDLSEVAGDLRDTTESAETMGYMAPAGMSEGRMARDSMAQDGMAQDSMAIGAVAFYWRDTLPVYRQEAPGLYVQDTTAIFRRSMVVVLPLTEREKRFAADSTAAQSRHAAAMERLSGLSGSAFDEAFVDEQIELTRWRMEHVRDDLIPLLWNDGLQSVANDVQTYLGIHLRRAQDAEALLS